MIFTYWEGCAESIESTAAHWRQFGFSFAVYSDMDVERLIHTHYPKHFCELYRRIRIPSCKSDVARLVLLEEFGGMYVDAHTGIDDVTALQHTLSKMGQYEVILFARRFDATKDPKFELRTGAIVGRSKSDIYRTLLLEIFDQLSGHYERENQCKEHVPYNIYAMSAGWRVFLTLFSLASEPFPLKDKYQGRVLIEYPWDEGAQRPFKFYKFYGYRAPGLHWSERQRTERLFL